MLLAEAAMKIDTAYLHAGRAADDLDRGGRRFAPSDLVERARVRMDTAGRQMLRKAVELLVQAHGTSSLADHNPLQRMWRDVHVASHHAITEWQVNLEVCGRALLGVEPNITHLISGLFGFDSFGTWAFRALSRVNVTRWPSRSSSNRARARRLVEEMLGAVARRNEPKAFVRNPLDRAVRRRHRPILSSLMSRGISASLLLVN